jgi:antitoxin ParD1/3/4
VAQRHVTLTDHQESIIEDLVRSGRYQDMNDVVREALRLLERREAEDAARLEGLRRAAKAGIEAIERGEYTEFAGFDRLERYLVDKTEAVIATATKR